MRAYCHRFSCCLRRVLKARIQGEGAYGSGWSEGSYGVGVHLVGSKMHTETCTDGVTTNGADGIRGFSTHAVLL